MRILLAIISVISFISCQEEIEIKGGTFEPEIYVKSILSTDANFEVQMSETRYVTDNQITFIDNADVSILDLTSGDAFQLDNQGDGIYKAKSSPQTGHDYRLLIDAHLGEFIYSHTRVPNNIDVKAQIDTIYDNEGLVESLDINLEIENDPNTEEFYTVEIQSYMPENLEDKDTSNPFEQGLTVESEQSTENAEDTEDGDSNETRDNEIAYKGLDFFSDSEFSDGEASSINAQIKVDRNQLIEIYRENCNCSSSATGSQFNEEFNMRHYLIKVNSVSYEYFNYIRSRELNEQTSNFNTTHTTPSSIEFNIGNGIGIFGAVNVQTVYIN